MTAVSEDSSMTARLFLTGSEADVTCGLFNLLTNVDGAKEESAVQSRPASCGPQQTVRADSCLLPPNSPVCCFSLSSASQ